MTTLQPTRPPADSAAAAAVRPLVAGRSCGSCTLCCKTVAVTELDKPAGVSCRHCLSSKGCAIYDARPAGCRDFYCEWRRSPALGPEWRPDRARFALMVTSTGHLSACVDPDYPLAWRRQRYSQALRRWACGRADDPSSSWPGVDVWIGPRCIVLLPDGESDLGVVAPDETIRIDQTMTAKGPAYVVTRSSAS